jgi:V/A-type H+-transporting ATPase subunit I
MAKTTAMRLIELMILKEDVSRVIEYLGKNGNFQFQSNLGENVKPEQNTSKELFDKMQLLRSYLGIEDVEEYNETAGIPSEEDYEASSRIITAVEDLHKRELELLDAKKRVEDAYTEAKAFSNLKVAYSELEHLSFLSLRIGKIDPAVIDDLIFSIGSRAVVMPLGEDKTRILAASSKKGRFALDSELRRFGFVPLEIPKNFQGIPDDVLKGMEAEIIEIQKKLDVLVEDRKNYADTHKAEYIHLLHCFSIGAQVQIVQDKLEATQLVYRLTGWVPEYACKEMMNDLDNLTEGRIAIRQYNPEEVPTVVQGREKVPVKLKHGPLVGNFERIIFSYGAPLYGTVDPTPFVAFFFTLLFGIMFGDAGQGLVFILIGILMLTGVIKKFPVSPKFGPIFVAIGCSSTVMGILTGEFFGNEHVLIPVSRFLSGLFGEPRDHILSLMPSADSIDKLFIFFLFTIGVGFIINSIGLVINIINQFILGRRGHALFGKTGLSGALFFWYVVFLAIRVAGFGSSIQIFDWVIIGLTLFGVFFASPLERLVEGHRPVFENGIGTAIIEGAVEILEVISSYLSNSVSFLRVGAFALAHAVLGFIIFTMQEMVGGAGGLLISVIGNVVVIVLEGMIVAIQVIRLQYYEFFSKFFTETGKEFEPFKFKYKE